MNLKTLSNKSLYPIGIGTWGFGGTWEPEYGKEDEAVASIRYSISKGQNHIDAAQIYGGGHTEEVIGQAIAGLDREDLFIGDKLWETNVAKGTVRPAVEMMLKKLGTTYLDVLYFHKPWEDFPWREAIPQINELIDEGVVRYFGVSNCNLGQIKESMKLSKHPIVLSQVHYNILNREELDADAQSFCADNGIQIVAYKPLERGLVLQNETVQRVAKDEGITPTQVALAWLLSQNTLPIPQSPSEQFIDENIAAAAITLSPKSIEDLNNIKT